jgi:hypothetical protein
MEWTESRSGLMWLNCLDHSMPAGCSSSFLRANKYLYCVQQVESGFLLLVAKGMWLPLLALVALINDFVLAILIINFALLHNTKYLYKAINTLYKVAWPNSFYDLLLHNVPLRGSKGFTDGQGEKNRLERMWRKFLEVCMSFPGAAVTHCHKYKLKTIIDVFHHGSGVRRQTWVPLSYTLCGRACPSL